MGGQPLPTCGGFSEAVSKAPAGTNKKLPGRGKLQPGLV